MIGETFAEKPPLNTLFVPNDMLPRIAMGYLEYYCFIHLSLDFATNR
jgi:hypothetical protein